MIEARDSRGCFAKGNVPWTKRVDSTPREGRNRRVMKGGINNVNVMART